MLIPVSNVAPFGFRYFVWKGGSTIPLGIIYNGGYSMLYDMWVCESDGIIFIIAMHDRSIRTGYCVMRVIDGMCVEMNKDGSAASAPFHIMTSSSNPSIAVNLTTGRDVFTAAIAMYHGTTHFWNWFEINMATGCWSLRQCRPQLRNPRVNLHMRALYDTVTGADYYSTGHFGPTLNMYDSHGRLMFSLDISTHGMRTWYAHSVYDGIFLLSAYHANDAEMKIMLMRVNAAGERVGDDIATNRYAVRMVATQIDADTIEYLDCDNDEDQTPVRVTRDLRTGDETDRVYLFGDWW